MRVIDLYLMKYGNNYFKKMESHASKINMAYDLFLLQKRMAIEFMSNSFPNFQVLNMLL
jgi:hypothetical protein